MQRCPDASDTVIINAKKITLKKKKKGSNDRGNVQNPILDFPLFSASPFMTMEQIFPQKSSDTQPMQWLTQVITVSITVSV